MGTHLPFVGYVKATGKGKARYDRNKGANKDRIEKLEAFFAALRRAPADYFRDTLVGRSGSPHPDDFREIIFETDTVDRPLLDRYKQRPVPKSLVIVKYTDLFSRTAVEDFSEEDLQIADQLAESTVLSFVPIICMEDKRYPLSAEAVSNAGPELRKLIWDNQVHFRMRLSDRLSQLGRLRNAPRQKTSAKLRTRTVGLR